MVDVGGTTTDIGAVTGGKVRIDRRGLIGGVPSSLPLAAIASHGVGGSSIIRVTDGRITVGPDSVGAAPGPACFGLGGTAATITDVYLLMGILDPATYLGGDLKLDTDRSAKAVTATIAEPPAQPAPSLFRTTTPAPGCGYRSADVPASNRR